MTKDMTEKDNYQNRLHTVWQHFIQGEACDCSFMPPEILHSWERSRKAGVNPLGIVNTILSSDRLNVKINNNMKLIEVARPYMEKLYSIIRGTDSYTLLSDKEGYILDYLGDQKIVASSQAATHLVPGACRQETVAGTNAIGTALYLRKPIQICGNEHYCRKHQIYTCSCAPIQDRNGNLIGAVNVTVLKELAHPHTLGMVLSASDSIAKELELTEAMQSIERISAQRNSIIEHMPSGLFLLTKTNRVSQVNTRALNMFGLSYEQIIGKNLFDYLSIDEGENGVTVFTKEQYNEEVTVRRLDSGGRPKTYRLSVHFIKDSRGTVTETLLRFNKTELIHKLVNNVGGYTAHYTFDNIIGNSKPVQEMIHACKKAAGHSSNVLILGESGTGKELVAQAIHNAGSSSDGPFLAINCASIPNSLVESELFGYEKGAFTGADSNGRPGKFEMADGGTIFLDEIGDMPLDIQAALLRVIQTREVVRIGGKYPRPINLRIIAATNQDLLQQVENKTFRSDLYYRLNVFTIYTPSLRERGAQDIRLLTDYFLSTHGRDKLRHFQIAPEVYPILESYRWPGNVRQLENVIERAVNLCDEENIITASHLPDELLNSSADAVHPPQPAQTVSPPYAGTRSVRENEKNLICSALQATGGNMTKAARALGMNLRTLYRRLDKYEIDVSVYR